MALGVFPPRTLEPFPLGGTQLQITMEGTLFGILGPMEKEGLILIHMMFKMEETTNDGAAASTAHAPPRPTG